MREIRTSGVRRGEPAIVHGMRVLSHNRGNPETDVDRSLNTLAGSPTLLLQVVSRAPLQVGYGGARNGQVAPIGARASLAAFGLNADMIDAPSNAHGPTNGPAPQFSIHLFTPLGKAQWMPRTTC
jgi:hypothetical protein